MLGYTETPDRYATTHYSSTQRSCRFVRAHAVIPGRFSAGNIGAAARRVPSR
jgi:hypothetical protein